MIGPILLTAAISSVAALPHMPEEAAAHQPHNSHVQHRQRNIHYMTGRGPIVDAGAGGAQLVDFGGPIIGNVDVHPIYYGTNVAFAGAQMEGFYSAIVKSHWLGFMTEYSRHNGASNTTVIGYGTSNAGISPKVDATKTALDDTDIQAWLQGLIHDGTLKPTANTYYPIHFDPSYSITLQGSASCEVFCAYHNTLNLNGGDVPFLYYGIMPDQGGACAGGCGSASSVFDNLCSVSSHELGETITDPAVGAIAGQSTYAFPCAWGDTTNGEIGDICNAQQGTFQDGSNTYTVQLMWSNTQNNCVQDGTQPASTMQKAMEFLHLV